MFATLLGAVELAQGAGGREIQAAVGVAAGQACVSHLGTDLSTLEERRVLANVGLPGAHDCGIFSGERALKVQQNYAPPKIQKDFAVVMLDHILCTVYMMLMGTYVEHGRGPRANEPCGRHMSKVYTASL